MTAPHWMTTLNRSLWRGSQVFGEEQMAGGRDRNKFGNPLDQAKMTTDIHRGMSAFRREMSVAGKEEMKRRAYFFFP